MKPHVRRFRNFLLLSTTVALSLVLYSFSDEYFELTKNLDIFSALFREVNTAYVDSTDPGKLMKTGINAMLESLDPYTNYIPESDRENYRAMVTGQYGGIGAVIRQRGDRILISEPYEGYPAARSGLRAGDELVDVDGVPMKGKKTDEVSRNLKGTAGTKVRLAIHREGIDSVFHVELTREEIKVKSVPYCTRLQDDIGYVKLSNFTERCSKELEKAVKSLQDGRPLKGLILDLRGNPGGLLQEAINVSNLFVEKGQTIVSTRGRISEMNRSYPATDTPLEPTLPLAVLVNSSSASASEIVSGSLQDLDRAVILGQRTYGKGLVQSTRQLSYNTQLKVTTAKYYIPSGRCIQAVDYSHRNADGSVGKLPDSLQHDFKTRSGRTVKDGGGILPDILTQQQQYSNITTALLSKNLIFDYATYYRTKHDSLLDAETFRMDDRGWSDFLAYLRNKEYEYITKTESSLEELKKNAEEEGYYDQLEQEYRSLRKRLDDDKKSDLDKNRVEICQLLEEEIMVRYRFQSGRTAASLGHDEEVREAISILKNPSRYRNILEADVRETK